MRSTGLATYARDHKDIKEWARPSLQESKLRREHAHVKVRTVLLLSGFWIVMLISVIRAMGPA